MDPQPHFNMNSIESSVPFGFKPLQAGGPYMQFNGPLYGRLVQSKGQKKALIGFRVESRHTNPTGACHGGMLASMADMMAAICVPYQTDLPRHFFPTISLQMDFLAPAQLGDWVQAETEILRTTRNLVFTQGLLTVKDQLVLRVSAIYKVGPLFQAEDQDPSDPYGLAAESAP
jgi:uncharacterized protein (TIGR00369 family)